MKVLRISVILVTLAALLGACSGTGTVLVKEPETAVGLVLAACQKGDYAGAARYFQGGPEVWEQSPGFVREHLDHITSGGQAVAYNVEQAKVREHDVLLQVTTYADPERTKGLRTMQWHFLRQDGGWLIRKVD